MASFEARARSLNGCVQAIIFKCPSKRPGSILRKPSRREAAKNKRAIDRTIICHRKLFIYTGIDISGYCLCCTGLTASASTIYIEYNGCSFYHIMMMLMLAILTALMLPRVRDALCCQKVFTVKATVVYPLSLLFYYDNSTYYCATIHWGCWGCPCSPLLQLQFVQCRKRSLSK